MKKIICLMALVMVFVTLPAYSGLLTFTNRTTWATAVGGSLSTTTFEGLAPAGGTTFYNAGYTDGNGTNFHGQFTNTSGTTEDSYIISQSSAQYNPMGLSSDFFWGGYQTVGTLAPGNTGVVNVNLGSAVAAAGLDYAHWRQPTDNPVNAVIDVTIVTNLNTYIHNAEFTSVGDTLSFIGYQGTAGEQIQTLTFRIEPLTAGIPTASVIDNFTISSSSVPEPSSMLLMGSALAGLGLLFRRRR